MIDDCCVISKELLNSSDLRNLPPVPTGRHASLVFERCLEASSERSGDFPERDMLVETCSQHIERINMHDKGMSKLKIITSTCSRISFAEFHFG